MNRIGVGIIGASPLNPGWGVIALIPALQKLPQYELRAVSTSNSVSAAANAFEVAAFDNHTDLIAHPGVDLVVVAVKVSHHHELVTAALDAGKIAFCEWPLGRNSDEAHDLAVHARLARVHNAIGLQARFAPAIQRIRAAIHRAAVSARSKHA